MELYELGLKGLSDLLNQREVSSVEVLDSVCQRIDAVEDKVGAYVTLTREQAREQAQKVDSKRAAGEALGRLAGLPIAVKDNICVQDVKTTCSSRMLHDFVAPYDATVSQKLKAEDAVIVGKTNMDEFAMGSSTQSAYEKKTANPYQLDCVPGGSSGGSAAAVAANEAAAALGSDTGGSIRQPAAFCGCVGLKPTYGTVSRYGLVAFASSLDQIGPMTKSVEDAALLMNVLAGHDQRDSTSLPREYGDFSANLGKGVQGLKVGLPKEYFGAGIGEETRGQIQKAARLLESMGAVVEETTLPMTQYALPAYYIMSSAEASSNLARYDGIKYGYRSEHFEDLVDLYNASRSEGFGTEVKRRILLGTYVLSSGYYDAYYKKAQQVRTLVRRDFDKAFERFDLLLTPVSPMTAWKKGEKSGNPVEMYAADICTVSVNIAGLPALSMPCALSREGMPIGLQLIGAPLSEATILQAGQALEQHLSIAAPKL